MEYYGSFFRCWFYLKGLEGKACLDFVVSSFDDSYLFGLFIHLCKPIGNRKWLRHIENEGRKTEYTGWKLVKLHLNDSYMCGSRVAHVWFSIEVAHPGNRRFRPGFSPDFHPDFGRGLCAQLAAAFASSHWLLKPGKSAGGCSGQDSKTPIFEGTQ